MATTDTPITVERYLELPDTGGSTELVRGRVVQMTPPGFQHGVVCANVVRLIGGYLDRNDVGRILSNDSGIITERGPDTVRGMDAAFYSYARLPKDQRPRGYPLNPPELAFEVRSPSEKSGEVLRKVAEYLAAGVLRVCILDPQRETITIYHPDEPERQLGGDDVLELPEILPGFRVPVARFFS